MQGRAWTTLFFTASRTLPRRPAMTTWHDDAYDDDLDAFAYDDALPDDALFGESLHGDGAADPSDLDDLHLRAFEDEADAVGADRWTLLTTDATGVRFEALARFAQPLFERYDIDPAEALADDTDETAVTLLETARLLWAFFSLDEAARDDRRAALLAHCYGPDADVEAWEDFADLLRAMEEGWDALSHAARADAEATDTATLDFDALLADDAEGSEMAECDARALFALPLLDDPNVQADPARFEDALHRADAYWSVAQAADRADRLVALLPTLADSADDLPALRAEAEQMLARYDAMFGQAQTG